MRESWKLRVFKVSYKYIPKLWSQNNALHKKVKKETIVMPFLNEGLENNQCKTQRRGKKSLL